MKSSNAKFNDIQLNTVISLLIAIFSAFYFYQSFQYNYWHGYGPGAGFMPRWTSGIMLVLSIISLVQSFKEEGLKAKDALPKGEGLINIITALVSTIFFAVFTKRIGFILASTIMLTVLFSRSQKWYKALIYAIILTLVCFYIFKFLLVVPVPVNRFGY